MLCMSRIYFLPLPFHDFGLVCFRGRTLYVESNSEISGPYFLLLGSVKFHPENKNSQSQLNPGIVVSTSTLLIYDCCLTLDLECKLVWSYPFKWINVLYLVQRYLPLVDTVIMLNIGTFSPHQSQAYCHDVLDSSILCVNVCRATCRRNRETQGLSEVLLSLRIWAISRDRIRHLAYIISLCFILLWGGISAMGIIFWSRHNS
ncbi:hypothetical protein GYMLUDRAFT_433203 [Collybiopsis luxurians FD-317 M1]|uniref:DUF6533 domain-containing protein n=1 Tax=Collybiopsis luxurians FD-317 M1 TaxID=944289 RepID=A0A0D0BJ08_9AGAR|nr:hypothetical protein GYMLUDRAFT_433203 [Collybiopsis luxurians FD-317 M1]